MIKKKEAFTLVELVVSIIIIGVLFSLVSISLREIRRNGRDTKRLSDIREIQTALESYYRDHSFYPSNLIFGEDLTGPNGKVYMSKIPKNIQPASANCPEKEYLYEEENNSYKIGFCLEKKNNDFESGPNCTNPISDNCFLCSHSKIIDERNNKEYETIKIAEQCWMKNNINIGARVNGIENQTNNFIIEKYCYSDLEESCDNHGGLYQWDEAMQYSMVEGSQGICPNDWHIPSDEDWYILESYLATSTCIQDRSSWDCSPASNKLKSSSWDGNNESGFSALPAGVRYEDGLYDDLNYFSTFWSSSIDGSSNAWYHMLETSIDSVFRYNPGNLYGYSIRCIRD